MKFYTQFNHNRGKGITFTEPSLVENSHEAGCNLNKLMERLGAREFLEYSRQLQQQAKQFYGDFSECDTFEEVMQNNAAFKSQFYAFPAELRREFDNNPTKFMGELGKMYSGDAEAIKRGEKLGLITVKRAEQETKPSISVNPGVKPEVTPVVPAEKPAETTK